MLASSRPPRPWEWLATSRGSRSRRAYGATFFTLTGSHGAHVFAGLVLLLPCWCSLSADAIRRKATREPRPG